MSSNRTRAPLLAAFLLLAGCDQSVNYSGQAETQLTGMYCNAKGEQEQSCKPGDVAMTDEGREYLVCDWGWQIVHQPGSNEVQCVYRGPARQARGPESVK